MESPSGFFYHTGHTGIFLLCEQLSSKTFWFTIINLTVINKQWWQADTNYAEAPCTHDYKETLLISLFHDFTRVPAYRNLTKSFGRILRLWKLTFTARQGGESYVIHGQYVIIHIKFEILLNKEPKWWYSVGILPKLLLTYVIKI